MTEVISLLSVQYTALFSIINPLGSAFVFFAITSSLPLAERGRLAYRVAIYTLGTLVASLLVGVYLLRFFGISLPVLRVAGGFIVALTAWQVLTTAEDPMQSSLPRLAENRSALHLAFYPLTMPLTIGPGSISVAIALAADAPGRFPERVYAASISVTSIALIALTVYLCYRFADRLTKLFGATGTMIVVRISGFLLFCIGFQIIWLGVRELVLSLS